ncbi:hypothetical protein CRYUN_Cryun06bG0065200 [Craigia yunnanensis]
MKGLDVAVLELLQLLETDVFLTFASEMAKDMQVSWIHLCVSVPHNLSAHIYTDLIRRLFNHVVGDKNCANFQHQTLEVIPGLSGMFVTDLSNEILPRDSKETFFSYMLSKTGFGTEATPPGDELIALAEAVEESHIPFLCSLNDNHKHHLPNGFLRRTSMYGKIVSWAPQFHVLGHASTGVFVTHRGANSVFESVSNGVPMIWRPMFGDKWMIGRAVEEIWGIGVRVEGLLFTKSGVLELGAHFGT